MKGISLRQIPAYILSLANKYILVILYTSLLDSALYGFFSNSSVVDLSHVTKFTSGKNRSYFIGSGGQ